ncbi:elongation factor P maturation arginine rhamnosyltransferase EarP [Paucibacter sp. AS339]|uniref:elongation factor P maturation arginine rhamnosyltransferase EarP n=1 Tax=Paucibacter hankyongi TaxID=3133434 RepID=UPI0030A17D87
MKWDLFCQVIDNFGDVGVGWRLARDLAERGESVRLWIDDASALQWMAPGPHPDRIEVLPWVESLSVDHCGDVVVETFGCELPQAFLATMASKTPRPPLWLNLEYLSAESYVERSHGLASPQFSGAGRGLSKQFFYPGFTARTGGLLREPGLLDQQARFDAQAWLSGHGLQRRTGERIVSLFAYPNPRLPDLLAELARQPTLLLVCPGAVQPAVEQLLSTQPWPNLRWHALPHVSQPDFDRLLWACDLNFVRGEDSFVRAQWAGKPFVWQIYPQADGAHGPKLEAFMDLWLAQAPASLAAASRDLWRAWNGLQAGSSGLMDLDEAHTHALAWREQLLLHSDLSSQLLGLSRKTG